MDTSDLPVDAFPQLWLQQVSPQFKLLVIAIEAARELPIVMLTRRLETSTQGSPLAPSVEKAYYRKCIQLKRRLNEVEAANDESKVRRVRLERAIMKMRLERAFLLEQLSKRVEPNVEGSDASGDEGAGTTGA